MAEILSALAAAGAAGFQRAMRDAAIRDTPGFEAAWARASNVPGYFSETNAAMFWSVIADCKPKVVVEIGSYQGRSTSFLGLSMQAHCGAEARLTAIDPHTGDRQAMDALGVKGLPSLELFRLHLSGLGIEALLDERVATALEVGQEWRTPVDLLFDDGWHSYESVSSEADVWIPLLADAGLICFDDYGHYDEVKSAVDEARVKHGLYFYGEILAQAWLGKTPAPPRGLTRALRVARLRKRAKNTVAYLPRRFL